MSRLKTIRAKVTTLLQPLPEDTRISAVNHLYGVSLAATMIGMRRGLDSTDIELVSIAAMLHDIYAYTSGSYDDHAHKGAEMARSILREVGIEGEDENKICSAIYHHDDKATVDSPLDEVLKDADVVHHCMNDLSKAVKEKERERFTRICSEFGLTVPQACGE